jgi:hypothetical protein
MGQVFKEGDRVYLYTLGWGTITELGSFFIVIKFDITDDNRHIGGELINLLSFTEYTLEGFSQERPEELPSRGDIVWIKEMDTKMYVPIVFMEAINDDYVLSFNFINIKVMNKDFVLTKNPYANEQ